MKNARRLAAFILTLSVIFLLFSCKAVRHSGSEPDSSGDASASSSQEGADQASPPSVTATAPDASAAAPTVSATDDASASPSVPAVDPFRFEEQGYKSGVIDVKYPQVFGAADTNLQDKLNKMMSDSALRDLPSIKGDKTLNAYKIDGTVAYNNPALVSVYFNGYNNYQQSAHPNNFLYSVTIDVNNFQTVKLKDLVKINASFIGVLFNGSYSSMGYKMTSDNASSIRSYLLESGTDFWLTELKNANAINNATTSYLTKDALVVSVSVPHVMGDHVEISLPYKELDQFKTNSLLWDVLQSEA